MNGTLREKTVHVFGSLTALALIVGSLIAVTVLAVIGWILIGLLFAPL